MSQGIEQANRPDFQCASHAEMVQGWTVVDDVVKGTMHMRNQRTAYLPQEPGESDRKYNLRLKRSVFFNAYKRTLLGLVGMVFRKDPKLGDDIAPEIVKHLENVDLAGTHFDVFAKEVFQEQVHSGHVFILVDMPAKDENVKTLADEIASGRRPYWVKYRAQDALNWRTKKVNGVEVLSQITFQETTAEESGLFGERYVTRYRAYRLQNGRVQWSLWEKTDKEELAPVVFEGIPQDEEGWVTTELKQIPVAIAYGRKCGHYKSEAPLLDLAYLNIAHWQEYSDYRNILHVANVPILCRIGASDPEEQMTVGCNTAVDVPVGGDVKFVEHAGSAIGAARQELVDLEQRMARLGLSLLAQRADTELTATEVQLDHAESESELQTMARSLQDCLEACLGFHAAYLGQTDGGSVEVDIDVLSVDPQILSILKDAVDNGRMSLESWLGFLYEGKLLPNGVTIEEEMKRLRGVDLTIRTEQ